MPERIIPETRPDYEASRWLKFGGMQPVEGDPETLGQFLAAHNCLTTITKYLTYVVGPWFTATPEEIKSAHQQFLAWSRGYNETSREMGAGELTVDISLQHLLAMSTRRLNALAEFGGESREDYPVFAHFHAIIQMAAQEEAEFERFLAGATLSAE